MTKEKRLQVISAYCEALKTAWGACPHLRLGQLIVNATGVNNPFYIEDQHLIEKLNSFADKWGD
jgi:hypothetical protein